MLMNVTKMIAFEVQSFYDNRILTRKKPLVVLFLLTDRQRLVTAFLVAWKRNYIVTKAN